jgi:hypothetical protein
MRLADPLVQVRQIDDVVDLEEHLHYCVRQLEDVSIVVECHL